MDFSESFSVDAALEDVWELMTDVERIAPCLPGAQLQEIDGEDYHGIVKVKVGPITSQYKGTARFERADEAEHKIVLTAQGRDTKGAGNANANIGVSLTGDASATQVMVDVHLDLKGKVAQFGRGVLADVSGKLMAKFAQNLSEMIAAGQAEAVGGEAAGGETGSSAADSGAAGGSAVGTGAAGEGSPSDAEGSTSDGSASDGSTSEASGKASNKSVSSQADEVEAANLLEVTGSRRTKACIAVAGAALLAFVLFIRRLFRRKKKTD